MSTVFSNNPEFIKFKTETWYKTRYRTEWFIAHTVGYALLATVLAGVLFFEATAGAPTTGSVWVSAIVWVVFLALSLMFFDYRTRRGNETMASVLHRVHKHVGYSVILVIIGGACALGLHTIARAIAGPPPVVQAPVQSLQPEIEIPPAVVLPKKKVAPAHPLTKKPAAKPPAGAVGSKPTKPAAGTKPALAKPVAKPNAGKPAKPTAGKPVKPPAKKPPAKPAK